MLLIDCASSHLGDAIARVAKRYGVLLVYVPAKLTFLLQPLDAHVFRQGTGVVNSVAFVAASATGPGSERPALARRRWHGQGLAPHGFFPAFVQYPSIQASSEEGVQPASHRPACSVPGHHDLLEDGGSCD